MICADYITDCLLGIIKISLIFNPWSAEVTKHSRCCCGVIVRSIFISFLVFTPRHRRNRKSCISCLLNIARWFKNFLCFNLFQGFLLQKIGLALHVLFYVVHHLRQSFYSITKHSEKECFWHLFFLVGYLAMVIFSALRY